tara:strand:+ start:1620 stop:1871 length:252 start_codon:yes stop_codon:yes gene_type:complete
MENFEEHSDFISGHDVLDVWFSSQSWAMISSNADGQDEASMQLVDEINEHLLSMIFHLENNSGIDRVQYELNYFMELYKAFEE